MRREGERAGVRVNDPRFAGPPSSVAAGRIVFKDFTDNYGYAPALRDGVAPPRSTGACPGLRTWLDHLGRVRVLHELPVHRKTCDAGLERLIREDVTGELNFIPAWLALMVTACRSKPVPNVATAEAACVCHTRLWREELSLPDPLDASHAEHVV
jgi:hypothetical protein